MTPWVHIRRAHMKSQAQCKHIYSQRSGGRDKRLPEGGWLGGPDKWMSSRFSETLQISKRGWEWWRKTPYIYLCSSHMHTHAQKEIETERLIKTAWKASSLVFFSPAPCLPWDSPFCNHVVNWLPMWPFGGLWSWECRQLPLTEAVLSLFPGPPSSLNLTLSTVFWRSFWTTACFVCFCYRSFCQSPRIHCLSHQAVLCCITPPIIYVQVFSETNFKGIIIG